MPPYAPYAQPKRSGGLSAKAIGIIAAILFVVFLGAAVAVWLVFFPPGLYVRDRFSSAHPEIESQIKDLNAEIQDGMVLMKPGNEKFQALLYKTEAGTKSTMEATVVWKEGDEDSMFGVVCCGKDASNFTVFMIKAKSIYAIYQYLDGQWYELALDLHLPKDIKIQKNVPYKVKAVLEGEYMSFYLNDVLLAKIFDSFGEHRGRVGVYAQGGKTGNTVIAYDSFQAKKNSVFQKD